MYFIGHSRLSPDTPRCRSPGTSGPTDRLGRPSRLFSRGMCRRGAGVDPGVTARSFWIVVSALMAMMIAAGAPSPLYGVYAERIGFSPVTLTVIFAIYVVALLATLLVVGSLSDHVGRKPVLVAALALEIVSLALFIPADSVAL